MRLWLLLLIIAATLPLAAQGQEVDEGPDWYQVELLIFANQDPEAASSESWTLLPGLGYPESPLRLRRDAPRVAADQVLQWHELEEQALAPAFDLAWDTPVEQLLSRYYRSLLWRRPSIELEPLFVLDVPVAYALLPLEQWEFAAERRRLDANPGLQVLFHESWLQPMRQQDESTALVVDAGPVKGDFTTLQGSIRIYRGRYLHLETNLWLNTDGSYLANDWVMPAPPLPRSAEDPVNQPFEVLVTDDWLSLAEPMEGPLQTETGLSADGITAADDRMALPWELFIEADAIPAEDATPPTDAEAGPPPLTEAELQAFLDRPDYPWRHAVLLQQTRRMRGGELHYIDHPMFGLLIKATRYEFEPFVETNDSLARSR